MKWGISFQCFPYLYDYSQNGVVISFLSDTMFNKKSCFGCLQIFEKEKCHALNILEIIFKKLVVKGISPKK